MPTGQVPTARNEWEEFAARQVEAHRASTHTAQVARQETQAYCACGECGRSVLFNEPSTRRTRREVIVEAHGRRALGRGDSPDTRLRRIRWNPQGSYWEYWERGHQLRAYNSLRRSGSRSEEAEQDMRRLFRQRGWKVPPPMPEDVRKLAHSMRRMYRLSHKGVGRFGFEAEFFGMEADSAWTHLRNAGLPVGRYDDADRQIGGWVVKHDGSVSNEGCELASPILAPTKVARQQSTQALDILRARGGAIDSTCGLHVHHSVAHKEPWDVAAMIAGYTAFQPTINSMLPRSRWNNEYAHPFTGYRGRNWNTLLQRIEDAGTMRTLSTQAYDMFGRYHVINMHALQAHGTIEFRQHSGTLQPGKVLHWVELTRLFVDLGDRVKAGLVVHPRDCIVPDNVAGVGIPTMIDYLGGSPDLAQFYVDRAAMLNSGADVEDVAANNSEHGEGCECSDCYEDSYPEDCFECGGDPCHCNDPDYV